MQMNSHLKQSTVSAFSLKKKPIQKFSKLGAIVCLKRITRFRTCSGMNGFFKALIVLALQSHAQAQTGTESVGTAAAKRDRATPRPPAPTVNYSLDRLNFAGINKSSIKLRQNGLEAEILARRNGIEFLQNEFQAHCNNTTVKPNWQDTVKSLGSEIYADHTFKIILAGSISDLIESPGSQAELLTADSQSLVFRIPTAVPFSSTRCGVLTLQLADGKNINVFPRRYTRSKGAESYTTVSLALSKSGNLYPVGSSDKETVKQSNLETLANQFQDRILTLPVVP